MWCGDAPGIANRRSDGVDIGRPGGPERDQEPRPLGLLPLEVAGLPAEPDRQLGHHAPFEVVELGTRDRARGEDGRRQPLGVAVLVAPDGTGIVGGHDTPPRTAARSTIGAHDQDEAEVGQLFFGQANRTFPEEIVNVLETVSVNRRRDAIPDRRRPDQRPRRPTPRVDRQVLRHLGGDEVAGRGGEGNRRGWPRRVGCVVGLPTERLCFGQPGKVLGGAPEVDAARGRRQEVEEGLEQRRLPRPLLEPADDDRQARLDEEPGETRQLRVEDAVGDELDDRAAWRRGSRSKGGEWVVDHEPMMTGPDDSAAYDDDMARTTRAPTPAPIDLGAAVIEIVPLTPDRWPDVAALFDEGGDPKTCSCMFWRVRSKDWSFGTAAEARDGFRTLVDEARDPAPGLLAYADGRAVGWVSVAPRDDYKRLTNSRVRPQIDDVPVWSIVCASWCHAPPAAST